MTRSGFTLIELIIVIGIVAVLLTITTVSLLSVQTHASLNTVSAQVLTDIKSQQLKTMTGETEGSGTISAYGIYFQSTGYVLFRGSAYSPADPANFVITLDSPVTLSTAFPSSTLVFTPGSGEITGYSPGLDYVTLTGVTSSEVKTLQFNRYGVLITQL